MMTTRRAMPPRMSARAREVLVVGHSYAPALLGWCSAMRFSLAWYPRSCSATLGTPTAVPRTQGVGLLCSSNCYANLGCFLPENSQYLSARKKRGGQNAWEAPVHDRLQLHTSE
jgi:hypothetical protein